MTKELKELLEYLLQTNKIKAQNLALSLYKYSKDKDSQEIIKSILPEHINVDLWELESLVNQRKFKFPKPEIGMIGVKDENN